MGEDRQEKPGADAQSNSIGRRAFLKSLLGVGSVVETAPAVAKTWVGARFFWVDLRSGNIGFPCGKSVPTGRPGSIMKIVATALICEERFLPPQEKIECRGTLTLGPETFKCLGAHGKVDLSHALGLSCNVYFAEASKRISSRKFLEYARLFGLDKEVAGSAPGRFPELAGPSSTLYVLGLAEDLQPGALQIMRVAALVANDGKLPPLHSAEEPDSGSPFDLKLGKETFALIRSGMKIAARQGTGRQLDPENRMQIACKTGTTPHGKKFESWICGYFPWDKPNYAFVLRAPGGTSQEEAVPEARKYLFSAQWS